MKRMTKTICAVIIVLTVIVMSASTNAVAGGGANWKVTITNPTKYEISAVVCCQINLSICMECDEGKVLIGPGQTAVVETGSTCPCSVKGRVHADGKRYRIAALNLGLGTNTSCCADCCGTAACWNSSITVKEITPPVCNKNEKYAFTRK